MSDQNLIPLPERLNEAFHAHYYVNMQEPKVIILHPRTYYDLYIHMGKNFQNLNKFNGADIIKSYDIPENEIRIY